MGFCVKGTSKDILHHYFKDRSIPGSKSDIGLLPKPSTEGLLGASWVVFSGVLSKVTILITLIRGLIAPLITTHEPPSRV